MNHKNSFLWLQRLLTGCVTIALVLGLSPMVARASSWSPTLLVNTESFNVIDDGDGSTDIEMRFGDTVDERLRWDVTNSRFQFTDDVHADGNITASGTLTIEGATVLKSTLATTGNITTQANLTINSDSGAANAVLTFGNDAGAENITFSDSTNRFEVSDDIYTADTLTVDGAATLGSTLTIGGVTYTFPASDGAASGRVLATNSAGQLSWAAAATDTDTTYSDGQGLTLTNTTFSVDATLTGTLINFTTVSGAILHARDQLRSSGTLLVSGASTLQAVTATTVDTTGNITTDANLTINEDNGAANAVLTFGNDAGAETITFSDSTNRFEVSDDIYTADTLTVDGAATFGSTVSLNGVTYTFPYSDGTASGKVLKSDGAGNLVWSSDIDTQNANQSLFETIAVSGESNVVADSTTDTLTLAAGSNVTITTNAGTDTVTIASTDTNTTYGAGQGLTLASTTFSVNSTLTGTLVDFDTVSGAILHARDQLRSSGTLLVTGASTLQAVTATTIDTTGNITTDANLTINEDNGGANAVLTFGNDAGVETLTFNDSTNEFDLSDDINVTGTLDTTGNITTDANLTINEDNGGANAVLTFGNDAGAETITFSDSTNRFEVSDDIYTADTLTVDGAATLGSTLTIGGVTYTFPSSDGTASGKVLSTNGAGQLSWTDATGANGSGNTIFLSPGYPFAVYFASGSTAIGQLYASGGNLSNLENNYTWTTSKSSIQDYWVSTRVKIPHNFSSWAPTPIQFRFKTGTDLLSENHLTMKFYDTAGTQIALGTGALAGTSWTTANITGPESTGTYTPDSYVTVMVKLASTSTASAQANAGYINLNWRTTTP